MTTTDTHVQVARTINASSADLFDVLSNPHRHTELDGSGSVRGLVRGDRLTATGQQFRMDMTGDHMGGEYEISEEQLEASLTHLAEAVDNANG